MSGKTADSQRSRVPPGTRDLLFGTYMRPSGSGSVLVCRPVFKAGEGLVNSGAGGFDSHALPPFFPLSTYFSPGGQKEWVAEPPELNQEPGQRSRAIPRTEVAT